MVKRQNRLIFSGVMGCQSRIFPKIVIIFLIFFDFDSVFRIKTNKKVQVLCIGFKVCLISNIFCPQTLRSDIKWGCCARFGNSHCLPRYSILAAILVWKRSRWPIIFFFLSKRSQNSLWNGGSNFILMFWCEVKKNDFFQTPPPYLV